MDAYAGIGLTGAAIAKAGGEVYNIEIVPEAVRDADKLYSANGLSERVHNVCGDANEELKKLIPTLKKAVSEARNIVIYIDPPRKGISAATAETLNRSTRSPRKSLTGSYIYPAIPPLYPAT